MVCAWAGSLSLAASRLRSSNREVSRQSNPGCTAAQDYQHPEPHNEQPACPMPVQVDMRPLRGGKRFHHGHCKATQGYLRILPLLPGCTARGSAGTAIMPKLVKWTCPHCNMRNIERWPIPDDMGAAMCCNPDCRRWVQVQGTEHTVMPGGRPVPYKPANRRIRVRKP